MPDDLRTRIAKTLHRLYGPSLGAHPDGWDREPGGTQEMYLEDADAVIRELGLREEWTWTWPRSDAPDTEWGFGLIVDTREEAVIEGDGRCRPAHRYVTEWTVDE